MSKEVCKLTTAQVSGESWQQIWCKRRTPTAVNICKFRAFSTLSLSLHFAPLFTQPSLTSSDPISGKYISLDYLFFTHKCILISGKFPNAISSIAQRDDEQWRWLKTTHSYACDGSKRCKWKMKWMNTIYQQICVVENM